MVRTTTRVAGTSAVILVVAASPVHARHPDVHERDVGSERGHEGHGRLTVGRFAEPGQVRLGVRDGADPRPDHGMVISRPRL